jgi:hypothetical protein
MFAQRILQRRQPAAFGQLLRRSFSSALSINPHIVSRDETPCRRKRLPSSTGTAQANSSLESLPARHSAAVVPPQLPGHAHAVGSHGCRHNHRTAPDAAFLFGQRPVYGHSVRRVARECGSRRRTQGTGCCLCGTGRHNLQQRRRKPHRLQQLCTTGRFRRRWRRRLGSSQ